MSQSIRLSLCMIVRDSAGTLAQALDGIRPWVDEIVVVDTGSVDETLEIAGRYGARMYHFPWCDNFSAARNISLEYAQGEWIFWMDSDDTIDADNGARLRALVDQQHPDKILGFVMQVHCPGRSDHGFQEVTVVDHIKLFRNRRGLRFEGRIHEQILMSIRRLGGEVGWTDIFVVHSGSDHSVAARQRKYERDLRILQLENNERPGHPFTLFNLGMTYADKGDYAPAIDALSESLAVSDAGESHVRKAYALLASCYQATTQIERALEICHTARSFFPKDLELRFREAILLHEQGQLERAADRYESILTVPDDCHFTSIDVGLASFKARHNLAAVLLEIGRPAEAEIHWRGVLRQQPLFREAHAGLTRALVAQRRFFTAEVELDRFNDHHGSRAESLLLQADLAAACKDFAAVESSLALAVDRHGDNRSVLHAWGRFLRQQGRSAEAKEAFERLVNLFPDDAYACFELGTQLRDNGEKARAKEWFSRAVKLRADFGPARLALEAMHREGTQYVWVVGGTAVGKRTFIRHILSADARECERFGLFGNITAFGMEDGELDVDELGNIGEKSDCVLIRWQWGREKALPCLIGEQPNGVHRIIYLQCPPHVQAAHALAREGMPAYSSQSLAGEASVVIKLLHWVKEDFRLPIAAYDSSSAEYRAIRLPV